MASSSSPSVVHRGVQLPRIESAPPAASSAGAEAVELARLAGLDLDPWQQHVLEVALGEQDDGRWSALEVGLIVPRQNGKGSILEARELAGLFLFGEELVIHSAHLFDTALDAFRRILFLIESTPDLDRQVHRVSHAHGEEGIELLGGQRLRFKTRTRGGGRGLSGDCIILDEAFELPASAHGALMPVASARPNPQIWYTSSTVDQRIHPNGVVLAGVRDRGIAGTDPRLAFLEWSIDPDEYAADRDGVAADADAVAQANPGLGYRLDLDFTATERRAMSPSMFATERLGVGDWPTPGDGREQVIEADVWQALLQAGSLPLDPVVFALDVTPDRQWASIAVAAESGRKDRDGKVVPSDGSTHLEVVEHRPGTRWVAGRLAELVAKWQPRAVLIDDKGPAGSLLPDLEAAGIYRADGDKPTPERPLVTVTAATMAQACGGFYDACHAGEVRHVGQPNLTLAVAEADQRPLSEAWAWSRKKSDADISPLVAVTLAHYGRAMYGHRETPTPFVAFG